MKQPRRVSAERISEAEHGFRMMLQLSGQIVLLWEIVRHEMLA